MFLYPWYHRPGSVAYVSRSGGMSNELNNIICQHTDGVHEGIAIGGDRYPGTTFMDHLLRYNKDPQVSNYLYQDVRSAFLFIYVRGGREGKAIGGDRYLGTTFMDHLLRYNKEPQVYQISFKSHYRWNVWLLQ